jgi:hypothetical protein
VRNDENYRNEIEREITMGFTEARDRIRAHVRDSGSCTRNEDPLPGSLSTETRPW